jgi:hypothetical protein
VDGDPTAYAGTVARLSPAVAEQNRTLLIEAEVPNTNGRLRPGSFAKAEGGRAGGRPHRDGAGDTLVTFAGVEKVLTVRDGRRGCA